MAARKPAAAGVWIGGRVPAPVIVEEGGVHRPMMTLWLEQPEGVVLFVEVEDPRLPQTPFGETLLRAMASPMIGRPRRPRRVRVADAALSGEVRRVCPEIAVEVGPTPEIRAVVRSLAEHQSEIGEPWRESYLDEGRASAGAVAALFQAAAVLWSVAPWRAIDGDVPLRIDAPALGLDGACVSVIGNAGESYGFLLFDSAAQFDHFVRVAGEEEDGIDLGGQMLSLSFEERGDVAQERRSEIAEHGWSVAAADAVPVLARRDADGLFFPLADRDYHLATKLALALASFFARRPADWDVERDPPVSESVTDAEDVEVRLTVPYDAWWSFQPIPAGSSDGPLGIGEDLRARLADLQQSFRDATGRLYDFVDEHAGLQAEIAAASRYFFRGRDPIAAAQGDERQIRIAFSRCIEWFALERASRSERRRPVEMLLDRLPEGEDRASVGRLAESVIDSFAAREVDPGNGLILEGLISGRRFEVFDRAASGQLVPGAMAIGRLFPLDGRFWTFSLQMTFLDDARAAEEIGRGLAHIPLAERKAPSQRDIEDVLSRDAPAVSDRELPADEDIEERLRALLDDAGIEEDIGALRRRMSRASSPIRLIEAVLGKGCFLDQEQVEETMSALTDLWNATPRPDLGGFSPAQMRPGDALAPDESSPARNAPCPCGSGKWYKRCCMRAGR